jgi:hypothetical protein
MTMKLDAERLRAEVDAHRARMESPLWTPSDGDPDESWTAQLTADTHSSEHPSRPDPPNEAKSRPQTMMRDPSPDIRAMELLPRLDLLDRTIEKLTAAVNHRPRGSDGVPGWLETAGGNPHTYDAPDAGRAGVCVRIQPGTYAQIQSAQRQMGLRTIAGAWEFLLRLGLAAAERLPAG